MSKGQFGNFTIEEDLTAASKLQLVQWLGAGYDYFDVEKATQLGIPLANNYGANGIAVAEHAILLMLLGNLQT